MLYFLTSSPCMPDHVRLNPANGFVNELRKRLPQPCSLLYICSDPDDPESSDRYSAEMRDGFQQRGFVFSDFQVLDRRNDTEAGELMEKADVVLLAGGHVPTQNRYFVEIELDRLLQDYKGVVIGVSAGTMNSAKLVYAQPEREGEAISTDFQRFLPGLGLTDIMILPHYQQIKHNVLDGLRLFEDITYPDSEGRCFYALPDGSYLFGHDGVEELRGEAYRIKEGRLEQEDILLLKQAEKDREAV